jgi:plastocyanin
VPANELTAELKNVVVFLRADGPARSATPAGPDSVAVMAQLRERFDPHVLPVLQGTRVEFPNYDDVYHNVFSLSRAGTFDLGRYPRGASRSVTFDRAGVVQVFCHIHADMSGIVMVLPNAFFTAPDTTGRYALEHVPAGEYTIVGWHERTRPVSYRVRVVAGQTTTIDFQLPLGATPDS